MSDYTSESYAKNYLPEKSLYPSDARIFHQAGYFYDTVEKVNLATFRENFMTAHVVLKSGGEAVLLVQILAENVFRLRFWEGQEPLLAPEGMLVEQKWPEILARFREEENVWVVDTGAYSFCLLANPFGLKVCDRAGRLVFELETELVAGKPITPPLGLRRSPREVEGYLSWRMHVGERFFGFGEKWNRVEKSGTRATIWTEDTAGTNTTDLSYKSVPLLYSSAGWGILAHTAFKTFWEVGTFSYTSGSFLVETGQIDAFLFLAPELQGLVRQYTALTGRPHLPPLWAMGVWMSRCSYTSKEQLLDVARRLRAEGIPGDVLHIDGWMRSHYYPTLGVDACDFDFGLEDWGDPEKLFEDAANLEYKISLWVNPYLPEDKPIYEEARSKGYLVGSLKGGQARLEFGEPVGMIDFTKPEAKTWWKNLLKEWLRQGAGVFKADYGDRVPEDALFFNGRSGKEMHNLYVHFYCETAFEALAEYRGLGEGMVWRRPGYIGTQRYPGTWAGDTQVSWEGLQGALHGGLNAGYSGDAFWSHDIGGFVGPKPEPELYIRWMQFGMLSPLTRFHGTTPREPWEYGPDALVLTRKYASLRYGLMPTLRAAALQAHESGLAILRHMKLAFPEESGTEYIDDQYMLGDELLVAPVLQPGTIERAVYFPDGNWFSFEDPSQVFRGPRYHRVPAPLDCIPIFVRAGAVLVRFDPVPQHLKGRGGRRLRVDLYPGESHRVVRIPAVDLGGEGDPLELRYECHEGQALFEMPSLPVQVEVVAVNGGWIGKAEAESEARRFRFIWPG